MTSTIPETKESVSISAQSKYTDALSKILSARWIEPIQKEQAAYIADELKQGMIPKDPKKSAIIDPSILDEAIINLLREELIFRQSKEEIEKDQWRLVLGRLEKLSNRLGTYTDPTYDKQEGIVNLKKDTLNDFPDLREAILSLRALNHDTRQNIIELLKEFWEMTVTDIYIKGKLEQSVASQHLAILRRAGIVVTDRQGKFIYYSLDTDRLEKVYNILKEFTDKEEDSESLSEAQLTFRAINHKVRKEMVDVIRVGNKLWIEMCVSDIYIKMRLEQSVASQHLSVLSRSNILKKDRHGKLICYSVDENTINNIKNVSSDIVYEEEEAEDSSKKEVTASTEK